MFKITALSIITTLFLPLCAEEINLFNGKDLNGWEGNPSLWSVQDGLITGITPAKTEDPTTSTLEHNTFLVHKTNIVKNFELTVEFKIESGNSGIQYRSKHLEPGNNGPVLSGYQADFMYADTPELDKYSGILYEEKGRGILALRGEKNTLTPPVADPNKPAAKQPKVTITHNGATTDISPLPSPLKKGEWNTYKIIANGNHLQHFINGILTADVTDNDEKSAAKEGIIGLQLHKGPPMKVQYRSLILKTLP
jgi:Domain of Unknown Function (DUF1080)